MFVNLNSSNLFFRRKFLIIRAVLVYNTIFFSMSLLPPKANNLGFFYNININNLLDIEIFEQVRNITKQLITYTLYTLWIAIIFHSFIVTIRNIILIYKFILVVYKG